MVARRLHNSAGMNTTATVYHAPVRPYSPIAARNRRAAAVGAPRTIQATECADYNGHAVTVDWNSYRRYYVAQYFWAGRRVLARGTFAACLQAALREYHRGAAGASIRVFPRADDAEAIAACEAEPALVSGEMPRERGDWWTWRHDVAVDGVRDYAHPNTPGIIFDWELLQAAASRADYEASIRERHGAILR